MGRIKDFLINAEEKKEEGINWVTIKQNEIIKIHNGRTSLIYNDLFELEDLTKGKGKVKITTINGEIYKIKKSSITYISGNCIRYTTNLYEIKNGKKQKIGKQLNSIPIDKIIHISIEQL